MQSLKTINKTKYISSKYTENDLKRILIKLLVLKVLAERFYEAKFSIITYLIPGENAKGLINGTSEVVLTYGKAKKKPVPSSKANQGNEDKDTGTHPKTADSNPPNKVCGNDETNRGKAYAHFKKGDTDEDTQSLNLSEFGDAEEKPKPAEHEDAFDETGDVVDGNSTLFTPVELEFKDLEELLDSENNHKKLQRQSSDDIAFSDLISEPDKGMCRSFVLNGFKFVLTHFDVELDLSEERKKELTLKLKGKLN